MEGEGGRAVFLWSDWEAGMGVANEVAVGRHLSHSLLNHDMLISKDTTIHLILQIVFFQPH